MAKDADTPKWRILVFSGQSDGDASARPPPQQLAMGPDPAAGNLTPIAHNMVLDVLWRQRLGTLYMEKVSPDEYSKHPHWVLEALPANYQLYAQIKPNDKPVSAKKLATTGHFFGLRLKQGNVDFESPEQFLPHLIWLGGDRSKACECHHCNPPPKPMTPGLLPLSTYLTLMQADTQPTAGLYRPGEMVWANPSDTYPVICIVAGRKMVGQELMYELIPLKSPRVASRPPLLLAQNRLRPWLSYTPPDPLQPSISSRKYQVRWDEINWQEWSHQDAELHDASIVASIRIACNIGITLAGSDVGESIACLWLGAEKIWRNGEVRVMTPEIEGQKGMDVLVIKTILWEPEGTKLFFQGNIYCKVLQFQPNKAVYPDPTPTPRMMADAAALQCSWHLKYQNVQINVMEIKGRWYPASVLRAVINPTAAPPDNSFYDVSGLLNNNTDIPNNGGGWKIGFGDREQHVLGIGHLPGNQPSGWINPDDWKRLYTDDTKQYTELTAPPPPPEPPAKTTKKAAATRKAPTKRASTKKQAAAAAAVPAPEPAPATAPTTLPEEDPQQQPQATDLAIAEDPQLGKPPGELYDDNQDQDDFLRQIEQDGANFEKSVQESDPWGFYG
ncbi:hypothetical protein TWF696_002255 [Orbilia brochopaga]|uniref:Cryptic loci regulator 2 N-terminal domain-containing protein n=1 Tax=Orbilia brochopaga TaxID=3140254 RepID=A0AAV9U738_9PEZI